MFPRQAYWEPGAAAVIAAMLAFAYVVLPTMGLMLWLDPVEALLVGVPLFSALAAAGFCWRRNRLEGFKRPPDAELERRG